jgi:hypothetical protein
MQKGCLRASGATHIFCAVQKAGYEPFHPTACQFLGKY